MVSRHDHGRRVAGVRFQIMHRRIGHQRLELLRVIAATIFRGPGVPDGEAMKTKHIHHTDPWHGGGKKIGPLTHHRTHQQTAVASAVNPKLLGTRIIVIDQPLRCRNEIIKNILLLVEHSCFMPVTTIFAAATQIRHRIDTATFDPG